MGLKDHLKAFFRDTMLMGCHSGRGCHLSLVRYIFGVAGCWGLERGLWLLHAARCGLSEGCFQGCVKCYMFADLTVEDSDCI